MTIRHHLTEDTLVGYAAGDLDEATSLLVATHLALCPTCRRLARDAEAIGGALIEDIEPAAMADDALSAVMDRLNTLPDRAEKPRPAAYSGTPVLPEPLRSRVGGDLEAIRWRRIAPGVQQARIEGLEGSSARLLKIAGGVSVPAHGHTGEEMTLVLSGGFSDGQLSFARGDIEVADPSVVHQPVADPGEDCICLAVTSAPLKFFDLVGRVAQPFIRI